MESDKAIIKRKLRPYFGKKPLKITQRRLPSKPVKLAESVTGKKFKKKPKLYIYEAKGGTLGKRTKTAGWDASSYDVYGRGKKHKPTRTIIVIPKSTMKDKKARDNSITHESAELLMDSHKAGMKAERKHLKKIKMTPREMTLRIKKLFNNPKNWR